MNFIKSAIGTLNYPSRLRVEGGFGGEFTWNSRFTILQIQSAINSAEQTSIPYSLLTQFSSLVTNYEYLGNHSAPVGAMIFISDTSDSALKNADRLFPKLKGISLTFVLLGPNVLSTKLRNFTSNFLYWQDFSQSQPDNWDFLSYHTYGCDAPFISSSSKPTTIQSTTKPYMPTPTIPPGSYYPCQNWVTVLIDDSNVLSSAQYRAQLNFTKSILGQLTHPERIRYGVYDISGGVFFISWNDTNTQSSLQETINSTNQVFYSTSIRRAIQLLTSHENQNRTTPDSTFIFVTDTTNWAINALAADLYNTSLKPGGIKLTFILAGKYTNASALSGFNDAI
uniref:VWFA domain-containing protein n=1 Tax=Panagrolaimus sp. ES5 TaxID=591445 RepID=A0AC34GXA9_9BILA